MVHPYKAVALALLSSAAIQAQAQNAARAPQITHHENGTPEMVRFQRQFAPAASELQPVMRGVLGLDPQSDLRPVRNESDDLGFTHQKFQQYYQGVKVENAFYTAHVRRDAVESLSGEMRVIRGLNVQPIIAAEAALPSALAFVHARQYMWEKPEEAKFAQEAEGKTSFRPSGELVIVANTLTTDEAQFGQPVLAWKFNIYAAAPVSRAWVYVDAHTGQVVAHDAIIKHADATASFATAYSGIRSMTTDSYNGSFRLREVARGLGIETYNMRKGTSYTAAVDFTDADNNWTAAEYSNANFDNAAGDAHFGAEQTYDYWSAVHGRNSYDNAGAKIKSYVHYGNAYENAYWNGSVMTYGDGASTFKPLTSLDVCAHEIGHAICEKTANLAYQQESGAMNEGFSDIWGACVEARAAGLFGLTGKSTWLIGEEIKKAGGALRSMSNPNAYRQPDTYLGSYYLSYRRATSANDYGGVHTNSGVLNFWFYLLTQGGSGTNDKGSVYSVAGVGIDAAAKIAFRTESVYLSANSTFSSARTASISAATDLYGAGSPQVAAVTNAWYAVGVGAASAFAPTTGGGNPSRTTNSLGATTSATIEAYPNPVADVLHVALPNGAAITSAQVYDLRGVRLDNVRFDGESFDVAGLARGMYTLTLSDGPNTYHVRFAKQ